MAFEFLFIFGLPVLISIILTPLVTRLAFRIGAIDEPDKRKVHTKPIPRFGGLVVCTSFLVAVFVAHHIVPDLFTAVLAFHYVWPLLVLAVLVVLGLGIWDDIHSLSAGRKLLVQIFVGTLVYVAGVRISSVSMFFPLGITDLGIFAYPVTILWIVGITNAFNLIDGLDGLASGVAIIASLTVSAIAFILHDYVTAGIALALGGAVLGFLPFNFNPARIFLGDSGSLFLGFVLAVVSIHSSTKGPTAFSLLVPLLALGLPITDTLLSMVRRVLRSSLSSALTGGMIKGGFRSIFLPDKNHIHHRLLASGLSHRSAVIVLYVVSSVLGLCAFAVTTTGVSAAAIMGLIGVSTVVGIRTLGYRELAVLKNGVLLSLYDRPLVERTLFQRGVDLAFIIVAFCVTHLLISGVDSEALSSGEMLLALSAVCVVQMSVFSFGGIYRGTFRSAGLGDILRALKTVTIAVIIPALLVQFINGPGSIQLGTFWILDFYLLASLVVGVRVSFPVLNYLFRKDLKGGKGVLIYGANPWGLLTLQKILAYDAPALMPIGFLDDDPNLEGKGINGYPIFGGHWKLRQILKKTPVHEIIFAEESVKPEVFRRLRNEARVHDVALRAASIHFENVSENAVPARLTLGGGLGFSNPMPERTLLSRNVNDTVPLVTSNQ